MSQLPFLRSLARPVFLGALVIVAACSSSQVPTIAERPLVAIAAGPATYVGKGDAGAATLRVFRDMKFELTLVVAPGNVWVAKGQCTASATSGSDFDLVAREIEGDMPRPLPATGVIVTQPPS